MKKKGLTVLAVTGLLLLFAGGLTAEAGLEKAYEVSGNKVFNEDGRAYLSAEPHTLTGSGWVEFTLKPKNYAGKVNAVWGFDTSVMRPVRAQYYNPQATETTQEHTLVVDGVISIQETTLDCDVGEEYNSHKRLVTQTETNSSTRQTETDSVCCFGSYT